jgi:folate-binding protein YgfZ
MALSAVPERLTFRRCIWQELFEDLCMKAALLSDRGIIKISGEPARGFLNGLVTSDIGEIAPGTARYAALLTPQGKIITDFIVTEAPAEDGGGFFLDCPLALLKTLLDRLTFYKLRAKITIEDFSAGLGVLAVWGGSGTTENGLVYPDPRLPALGLRVILPAHLAGDVARELGATLVDEGTYEAHRVALGVPRGGFDFIYSDAFPHDADMDQLGGVDFKKGCYIGQEVVSRVEHRGSARTRVVPVRYEQHAPDAGVPVMLGDKSVGMMGSTAGGKGLALLRLDRIENADAPLTAGGIPIRIANADWIRFDLPAGVKAAS